MLKMVDSEMVLLMGICACTHSKCMLDGCERSMVRTRSSAQSYCVGLLFHAI